MSKAKKSKTIKNVNANKVIVICHDCGSNEIFNSVKAAKEWIKEDCDYNGHDSTSYQIFLGKEVKLSLIRVTVDIEI